VTWRAGTGPDAARAHLTAVLAHLEAIQSSAARHGLDPAIVAAVISRETGGNPRWCLPPPRGQLGDGGHGHGPMQIDDRSFPDWCSRWRAGELDVADGIEQGCEVLASKLAEVARLAASALPVQLWLQAGIAAYNCGSGRAVRALAKGADPDLCTTGSDYSKDVLAQAEVFRSAIGGA
jgi:hypothetical protein